MSKNIRLHNYGFLSTLSPEISIPCNLLPETSKVFKLLTTKLPRVCVWLALLYII